MATASQTNGVARYLEWRTAQEQALGQPSILQAQKNQRDQQQKEKHSIIRGTRRPKGTVRKEPKP